MLYNQYHNHALNDESQLQPCISMYTKPLETPWESPPCTYNIMHVYIAFDKWACPKANYIKPGMAAGL